MKKLRTVLLLALACVMLLAVFTGCSKKPASGSGNNTTPNNNTQPDDPSKYPEVNVMLLWLDSYGANTEEGRANVAKKMKELVEPIAKVKMNVIWTYYEEYFTQLSLDVANGVVYDLCMGNNDFNKVQANGLLQPISDEDLNTYAPDFMALMKNYLPAMTINGKHYALPIYKQWLGAKYISFNAKMCQAAGYTMEDIHNMKTWDEVDVLFAKAKAAYGDGWVGLYNSHPVSNQGLWLAGTNAIHADNEFAKADVYDSLNDSLNVIRTDANAKVSCVWEQVDAVTKVFERARRWYENGYIWGDSYFAMYDGDRNATFAMIHMTEDVPEVKFANQYDGGGMWGANIGSYKLWTSSCTLGYFAIPVTAEEPEAALRVVNVIYAPDTSAKWGNLMVYGIEGTDYKVGSDGRFSYPDGKDRQTISFRNPDWEGCCPLNLAVWDTQPADYRATMKAKLAGAELSPYFGCVVNTADYATLVNNIDIVAKQYVMRLSWGMYTPEEYSEFRTALKSAGIDDYVKVFQDQLDTWMSSK